MRLGVAGSAVLQAVSECPRRRYLSFQFWDADVAPTKGKVFTVTNKDYFQRKKKGEMVELGDPMKFERQDRTENFLKSSIS